MRLAGRAPVVSGNWKMNTNAQTSLELAGALRVALEESSIEVIVFPPFTNIDRVIRALNGTRIRVGAQDVFWEKGGAFTGEISCEMLISLGVSDVLVGHSERRHLLGETDETVNRKAIAALGSGLNLTLAIGETFEERTGGEMEAVLARQLSGSLAGLVREQVEGVIVAYEPVWAIGTGQNATPEQANEAHSFVRGWLDSSFGAGCGDIVRIQYGGSVNASNAGSLFAEPNIDGALVGGASLKPGEFAEIVKVASRG
jgi:triosephosphate isomerase